jgi:D-aminoacyl-tRNA deacylase
MLGIVVSRADEASVAIGEQLLDLESWERTTDESRANADGGGTVYRTDGAVLREFDALHLELERVGEAFANPDVVVFASRHAGETGPLLTAHHTGNFGEAEYGGTDGCFALSAPNVHRSAVEKLTEYAPDSYDVGTECTHHGPTDVDVPSLFVELGSGEPQWGDKTAARAVARAILSLRDVATDVSSDTDCNRQVVGFGGGHYAPRFERVVRETDWAVGHVGAEWCLDGLASSELDPDTVIERAFAASQAEYALVTGSHPDLVSRIKRLGYRVVTETFLRETTGVPLSVVDTAEDAIGPVDDGLRFGEPATDGVESWHVVALPEELRSEATGIDTEAVRSRIARTAVAFGTEQNGTVVTGLLMLPESVTHSDIVSELIGILGQKYDSVDHDGEMIRAREQRFDPELARSAGVPEGPKFGRLSAGKSVDINGETVTPEDVHTERVRQFPLSDPESVSDAGEN